MRVLLKSAALAFVAGMCLASATHGAVASRVATQDSFIYSSTGPAGPPPATGANSNFGNFTYHGVSKDRDAARLVYTLIQFDTSGLSLDAGEGAQLQLYSRPKSGTVFNSFTVEPSAARPITVDVFRVTSSWTETGVTFQNQPTIDATPAASFVVDGINKFVSADITNLLAGWIAAPGTNFGLELRQRDVVQSADGQFDAAVLFNARTGTVGGVPMLVVPEPAALASIAGLATMAMRRRR